MESGVARVPIDDFEVYQHRLETLISRRFELMRAIIDRARSRPRRVVFPEGEHDKILRAAKILVDRGIAHPVSVGATGGDRRQAARARPLPEDQLTIIHGIRSDALEGYAEQLHERRRRDGVTLEDAHNLMRSRNYFGTMMVELGDADGLISGLTHEYADTIRPALAGSWDCAVGRGGSPAPTSWPSRIASSFSPTPRSTSSRPPRIWPRSRS